LAQAFFCSDLSCRPRILAIMRALEGAAGQAGGVVGSQALRDFMAGTLGGMSGIVCGHPLDTAKTRLQAMPRFEGASTWTVIQDTARVEGPRVLYRGMSFPLCSAGFLNATVFCVQGVSERALASVFGHDSARLNGFLAGCFAGLAQSPLVSAADLVKCQRQVQFASKSASSTLPGPITVIRQRVAALGRACCRASAPPR